VTHSGLPSSEAGAWFDQHVCAQCQEVAVGHYRLIASAFGQLEVAGVTFEATFARYGKLDTLDTAEIDKRAMLRGLQRFTLKTASQKIPRKSNLPRHTGCYSCYW